MNIVIKSKLFVYRKILRIPSRLKRCVHNTYVNYVIFIKIIRHSLPFITYSPIPHKHKRIGLIISRGCLTVQGGLEQKQSQYLLVGGLGPVSISGIELLFFHISQMDVRVDSYKQCKVYSYTVHVYDLLH